MLALVLAAELVTVTNQAVEMKLTAAKSKILVGEFTKLRLQWTALKPIEVLLGAEDVLIDDGSGFQEHLEAKLAAITNVTLPSQFAAGEGARTEYQLGLARIDPPSGLSGFRELGASLRPVFSHPGRYRVKVRYTQAESNEVEIEVVTPTGREAQILQELYRQPVMLTWMVGTDNELSGPAEGLIGAYGSHPYLARTILELIQGQYQDTFDRLLAMDFSQSAFADEHLLRIAERGGNFFGEEFERQTLQQLIERFPGSLAEQKASELLRRQDQDPPALTVAASPSSLWPPNHKLVSIAVAVQVSDERDPSPDVKLVSITCDDACDPALDIEGVTYGTDDRQFDLRSERKGTSATGRTYTITYSAEDAAGNKAAAVTKVTIAHDQGKNK